MDAPGQMIAAVGSAFLAGSFFVTVAQAIGRDRRKRTLVDLVRRDLDRDPLDAAAYDVQDAVLRQDMEWLAEELGSRRLGCGAYDPAEQTECDATADDHERDQRNDDPHPQRDRSGLA